MTRDAAVIRLRLALVTLLCWSVSVAAAVIPQTVGSRNVLFSSEVVIAYGFGLALPLLGLCLLLAVALPRTILAHPTRWAIGVAIGSLAYAVVVDGGSPKSLWRNIDILVAVWLGGLSGVLLFWSLLKRDVWHRAEPAGARPDHHPA